MPDIIYLFNKYSYKEVISPDKTGQMNIEEQGFESKSYTRTLILLSLLIILLTSCGDESNASAEAGMFRPDPTKVALYEAHRFYSEAIEGTRESPIYDIVMSRYSNLYPDAFTGLLELSTRNRSSTGYCSGFGLQYESNTIILTADHCIEPTPSIFVSQPHFDGDGIRQIFGGAEYVVTNYGFDLRMLKFQDDEALPVKPFPVISSADELDDIVDVFIPSFPYGKYYLASGLKVTNEWPKGLGDKIEDAYFLHGISGARGASGAPVFGITFNGDVKLIGLLFGRAINTPEEVGGVMQIITEEILDNMLMQIESETD